MGLTEILFGCWRALCQAALDVVAHCPCTSGCPGCVGPVEEVGPLGKETARAVLAHFVHGPDPLSCDEMEEALEQAGGT